MSDVVPRESGRLPSASAPEFVATFAAILVLIVILLFVDTWLARVDRDESRAHAASLYAEGRQLLAAHQTAESRDRFASAFAIERTNFSYELGLAEATLADGHPTDAERTLQSVLDRAESDGAANLLMARVLVREGRPEEATSFYHRAIYGRWRSDSLTRRMQTRFELIELLARRHSQAELLAELLPIQDVSRDSLALRMRLGHLFIQAGSPARGADIFRMVLREASGDAAAYAGMGEAALALGNFRTARADLEAAARRRPGDTAIANRLMLADTTLALDPTQPRLGDREREARARRVLAISLDLHLRCAGSASSPRNALVDSARSALASSDVVWRRHCRNARCFCGEPSQRDDRAAILVSDAWRRAPHVRVCRRARRRRVVRPPR
ncbi:MAG: tetratricopeptide repeat protein [Gemmatimonadaceae bacterium]